MKFPLCDLIDKGVNIGDLYQFDWEDWTYDVYTECVIVVDGTKVHTYLCLMQL